MIIFNLFKNFPHKFLTAIYILIILICACLYKFFPFSPIIITENKVISDWPYDPKGCLNMSEKMNTCKLDEKLENILLFGDSHAGQLVFGFDDIKNGSIYNDPFNLLFLTGDLMSRDWPSIGLEVKKNISAITDILSNTSKNDRIIFAIKSRRIEKNSYDLITGDNRLEKSLSNILTQIFSSEKIQAKIILMLDTPNLQVNVARICSNLKSVTKSICSLDIDYYRSQNTILINSYKDAVKNSKILKTSSTIYDPSFLFYKSKKYSLYDESGFMLIDGNHIKASVSKKLVNELIKNEF